LVAAIWQVVEVGSSTESGGCCGCARLDGAVEAVALAAMRGEMGGCFAGRRAGRIAVPSTDDASIPDEAEEGTVPVPPELHDAVRRWQEPLVDATTVAMLVMGFGIIAATVHTHLVAN
jgi:hypothetical protein